MIFNNLTIVMLQKSDLIKAVTFGGSGLIGLIKAVTFGLIKGRLLYIFLLHARGP